MLLIVIVQLFCGASVVFLRLISLFYVDAAATARHLPSLHWLPLS